MTITPQSIRDKEFQLKLRGYDQTEVKEYLERIAEEHLRLMEQLDKGEANVKALTLDNSKLQEKGKSWEQDVADAWKTVDGIKDDCRREKELVEKQKQELKTLRETVNQLEAEKRTTLKTLDHADAHIKKLKAGITQEQSRKKKLHERIHLLEVQNKDVQKIEDNLKKTLATAYTFSERMMQESEEQASEVLNHARLEIEKLRREAREELAYFPAEIKRMKDQHDKVKDQLRSVANEYLGTLDKPLGDIGVVSGEEQGESAQDMTALEEEQAGRETRASSDELVSNEETEKDGNGVNQQEDVTMPELEDQDELFQSIHIPDDLPIETDYLDEISKNIFLPLDMEDEH